MNTTLNTQPLPQASMDTSIHWMLDEKRVQTVDGSCEHRRHHSCSRRKLNIGIMILIMSLLLGALTFIFLNLLEATGDDLLGGFWKRALGDGVSGTGNESTFTRNKRAPLRILCVVLATYVHAAEVLLVFNVSVVAFAQNSQIRPSIRASAITNERFLTRLEL
ncbi:hypothetical protein PIIN_10234 [Serendipita indica DSM 11827]|uniref:Uncharacterized protein n=1 Tax=Serendipita indica (strain DSM 11827) TaxID=1109443 RepID=G4TY49_SERID|nr:hypothetical protein PIIN_10234 [Serendipita indica DSM 11827]